MLDHRTSQLTGLLLPLADRHLVHPDAFDEVGLGVDEGDGDLLTPQSLGEAPGGDGSGVSGTEDDDAALHVLHVLHVVTPVSRSRALAA